VIASRREAVGTTKQEAPSRSWVGFVMSQKENPKNLYVRSVLGQGLCHRRQVSSSSVSLSVCSVCVRLDGGNARAGTHNTLPCRLYTRYLGHLFEAIISSSSSLLSSYPLTFLTSPSTRHAMGDVSEVSVVLVGCGAPLKSMGWYHATQLLHKDSNM
jgi:hypothetical protein